jgi:hypothetical protein
MNPVLIDFLPGTNGTYLDFIGNVFLIPTIAPHIPFCEDNSSHNYQRTTFGNKPTVFNASHYLLKDTHPDLPFKNLLDVPHSMIWINVDKKDWIKLKNVLAYKMGGEKVRWAALESMVFENEDKPPWALNGTALHFDWGSLFSEQTFFSELKKVCDFIDIAFEPSILLKKIHGEFVKIHEFLL